MRVEIHGYQKHHIRLKSALNSAPLARGCKFSFKENRDEAPFGKRRRRRQIALKAFSMSGRLDFFALQKDKANCDPGTFRGLMSSLLRRSSEICSSPGYRCEPYLRPNSGEWEGTPLNCAPKATCKSAANANSGEYNTTMNISTPNYVLLAAGHHVRCKSTHLGSNIPSAACAKMCKNRPLCKFFTFQALTPLEAGFDV